MMVEDKIGISRLECLMNCDFLERKRLIARAVGEIKNALEYQRAQGKIEAVTLTGYFTGELAELVLSPKVCIVPRLAVSIVQHCPSAAC